ncbi:hypothetical protein [Diaphorobacter sp. ED-3]|uniref:hypothetical protein n=1 Tax=Diaphorobacter sp. ED-3 TaxID=3016636 RepID=UPI0022DDAD58|nr:hypothetical protein [Diaphorobacter sp. ED-3]
MSYPLINGSTINGADTAGTEGIDLVSGGQALAVSLLLVGDATPLEMGVVAVKVAIQPSGVDLVAAGQAQLRYNQALQPAGIDLVQPGQASMSQQLAVDGAVPLEIGQHRVRSGTDVAVKVSGLDLVRTEFHSMIVAQPAPNVTLQADGAYPLEVGEPEVAAGTIALQASGAAPLELGVPAAVVTLGAAGAQPLELGSPGSAVVLGAASSRPLEMGTPSLAFGIQMEGLDLVRAGAPSIGLGVGALSVAGAWPLELGEPGMPTVMLQARQAFPLAVGQPWIDRGTAC